MRGIFDRILGVKKEEKGQDGLVTMEQFLEQKRTRDEERARERVVDKLEGLTRAGIEEAILRNIPNTETNGEYQFPLNMSVFPTGGNIFNISPKESFPIIHPDQVVLKVQIKIDNGVFDSVDIDQTDTKSMEIWDTVVTEEAKLRIVEMLGKVNAGQRG